MFYNGVQCSKLWLNIAFLRVQVEVRYMYIDHIVQKVMCHEELLIPLEELLYGRSPLYVRFETSLGSLLVDNTYTFRNSTKRVGSTKKT